MIKNNLVEEITQKVKKVVIDNKLIQDGDKLVVALSGGPDSMCLIDVLDKLTNILYKEYNISYSLVAAHVNHMMREESKDEKIYVEQFCNSRNIPFFYLEEDVKKLAKELKMSDETCGRKVRYDFFEKVRISESANKIAVAHNLDDNVETILLNVIRGSGLKGLTGMGYSFNYIIRPLLDVEKKDILEYNRLQNLNPCFDKTNEEDIYARNKIRLKLIPELKNEYNTNILANITRMKHILEADENFLDNYTEKLVNSNIIDNNINKLKFNFEQILEEHQSIKLRSIRKIIEIKLGTTDGIENIHVMDILKLLTNNIKGKKYIIGNKFTIEILKKNIAVIYNREEL